MRYVSHYSEYPIYEPAEGGYYYAGNQIVESERLSKRKAKQKFEEIWKECLKENEENGFVEGADWKEIIERTHIYPWERNHDCEKKFGDYAIYRDSYYIGEGESYVIERKIGRHSKGWEPYC